MHACDDISVAQHLLINAEYLPLRGSAADKSVLTMVPKVVA